MSEYSKKIKAPTYEIKGEKPKLSELVNTDYANSLMNEIDKMVAPKGVKDFLYLAATRHYKFNFQKIAEYYANSPPNVQKLMEDSALVIIDFDDAVANGFVKMSKRLMDIRSETE